METDSYFLESELTFNTCAIGRFRTLTAVSRWQCKITRLDIKGGQCAPHCATQASHSTFKSQPVGLGECRSTVGRQTAKLLNLVPPAFFQNRSYCRLVVEKRAAQKRLDFVALSASDGEERERLMVGSYEERLVDFCAS